MSAQPDGNRHGVDQKFKQENDVAVFVLDRSGIALMPCSEKRAKRLLARGRVRAHRVMPFAIRIVDRHARYCQFQELRIKIDPGSKFTGIALVREVAGRVSVLGL